MEAESSEMGGIVTEKQVIELPSRWEVLVSSEPSRPLRFLLPETTGPGKVTSNSFKAFQGFQGERMEPCFILDVSYREDDTATGIS